MFKENFESTQSYNYCTLIFLYSLTSSVCVVLCPCVVSPTRKILSHNNCARCHGVCGEVGEQILVIVFPSPHRTWGWNLGCQAWQQMFLFTVSWCPVFSLRIPFRPILLSRQFCQFMVWLSLTLSLSLLAGVHKPDFL